MLRSVLYSAMCFEGALPHFRASAGCRQVGGKYRMGWVTKMPIFISMRIKQWLAGMPGFKQIATLWSEFRLLMRLQGQQTRLLQEGFYSALMQTPRYTDPKRLMRSERQVFSQNGEDGVIREIFNRIGETDRSFVEVGVGNGLENNTAYLLQRGWKGLWIDGSQEGLSFARGEFKKVIDAGRLRLLLRMVSGSNIDSILREAGIPDEFDLLSLDIDRDTYFLWQALGRFRPRVVVIEYNATIPPEDPWCVDDDPNAEPVLSSYFGASLKSYEKLGSQLGYALVGCESSGNNAFFVRSDLVSDAFSAPFTSENHYEPPRYFLYRCVGHPRRFSDARRTKPDA